MDIFRSIIIGIALILFIFVCLLVYYEMSEGKLNIKFPPYSTNCPDYSYETADPGGTKVPFCMFTDQFNKDAYANVIQKQYGLTDNSSGLLFPVNSKVNTCNNSVFCSSGKDEWGACNLTNGNMPGNMGYLPVSNYAENKIC